MAHNRVIGKDGKMPWYLPSDRRRFRRTTMGHPVILGRKTFESIGYPLEGRRTIVLTRNSTYLHHGIVVVHSIQEALAACAGADEAFIGGGEEVFLQTMLLADRIYLTVLHEDYEGDAVFPEIPSNLIETGRQDVEDETPYTLLLFERENHGTTAD